jgi:secretion/DNA translocation related CpaE-like protein
MMLRPMDRIPGAEWSHHAAGRSPLLITGDLGLAEEILRLAAAAGVDIRVIDDPGAARASWATALLILVGADLVSTVAGLEVPRRPDVIVVGPGELTGAGPSAQLWRSALAIGAEQVVQVPDADGWLIQRLGDTADGPSRAGSITAVTCASGGAGVSTLAACLALAAQESHDRVLLIDTDQDGGGLDLMIGAEDIHGIRWPDLADAQGRLSANTLDYALPHYQGLALLSHSRLLAPAVSASAFASVLDAGARGYDRVVIDTPRSSWDHVPEALMRADRVIIVVPARVRAIAAAARAIDHLREVTSALTIVVRACPRGVAPREVERALGCRGLQVIPEHPVLAVRSDRGEQLLSSDVYGKSVRTLLADLSGATTAAG